MDSALGDDWRFTVMDPHCLLSMGSDCGSAGRKEKLPHQSRIAERLSAAGAQSRERCRTVSECRARIRRLTPQVRSQKSGIEAVAGANGIDGSDRCGWKQPAL